MNRFEIANANPMMELAKKHAPLKREDSLPFSCRGCGNYCCGDLKTPIYVLPPEYIRIQWHFLRHPEAQAAIPNSPCFTYDEEHVSGLPVMKLSFRQLMWQGFGLQACPFLAVHEKEGASTVMTCLIHPARPHTCRIFPVGMTMEGASLKSGITTSYYMMSYCPGFEMPNPTEQTLPGYQPPSIAQSVGDWLDNQMDNDQYEEILYHFFEVMNHYYKQGWHLSLPGSTGSLSQAAYQELSKVFYNVPNPPADDRKDHEEIMKFLTGLRTQAAQIVQYAQQRSSISLF